MPTSTPEAPASINSRVTSKVTQLPRMMGILDALHSFSMLTILYSLEICLIVATVDCTMNISHPASRAISENFLAFCGIQLTTAGTCLDLISLMRLEMRESLTEI